MKKDYKCSQHGGIGHPDCEECWGKLRQLVEDKKGHLTGEVRRSSCVKCGRSIKAGEIGGVDKRGVWHSDCVGDMSSRRHNGRN